MSDRVRVADNHPFYPGFEGELDHVFEGLAVIKIGKTPRGADEIVTVKVEYIEYLPEPATVGVQTAPQLYAFEFHFDGMALGGSAVVLAPNKFEGEILLTHYLAERPEYTSIWRNMKINLAVDPPVLGREGVIYFNGDY